MKDLAATSKGFKMFLIGSQAAKIRGVLPRWRNDRCSDWDIVGNSNSLNKFLDGLRRNGLEPKGTESMKHPGKWMIKTNRNTIYEFDATNNKSNELFNNLPGMIKYNHYDIPLWVVDTETLYLIKRSHANYPIHWVKNAKDMISFANEIGHTHWLWQRFPEMFFGTERTALFWQLKTEAKERYSHLQDKIKLSGKEDRFFEKSAKQRHYVHDDLHRAISYPGEPMFTHFKVNQDSALLSRALFERASVEDRVNLFQEEAMVIGLERFYVPSEAKDRMTAGVVYRYGAMKLLHTMCKGWFQDFGLDHLHMMMEPKWDFIKDFKEALEEGRVREQ